MTYLETVHEDWGLFISRMLAEADKTLHNNRGGIALVQAHVAIHADGRPLVWVVSDGKRIEPSRGAAQFIAAMIDSAPVDKP